MEDLKCINCDTPNLVDNIAESFECGECREINPGIDVDTLYSDYVHLNKMYSELADRLRVRDREVERLSKLLIDNNIETDYDMELCVQNEEIKTLEEVVADIAKTDLADSVDHLWLSKWRNETKEKAHQALEKLKEIRKKK